MDKLIWKKAYATFVIESKETPEECANKSLQLTELLPILGSLDRKWKLVEPEMMVTTHKMVHRMRILLHRFRTDPKKVYDTIYEVREANELSAEVDPTINKSKTESENSDDVPIKKETSELGLKKVPSGIENANEEIKVEKEEPKPWEQAANNKQP